MVQPIQGQGNGQIDGGTARDVVRFISAMTGTLADLASEIGRDDLSDKLNEVRDLCRRQRSSKAQF